MFLTRRLTHPWLCVRKASLLCAAAVLFLVAGGTAFGGTRSVLISWNDAPPGENVMGYIVEWGTVSGVYTNRDASIYPDYDVIGGLQPGYTYYFRVYSVDAAGDTSGLSDEVSYYVPFPKPVTLQMQIYTDDNGVPFAMNISGTNSTPADWELDSSTDLVNWTYVTGDHYNGDPNSDTDVSYDLYFEDADRLFFRVVTN